MKKIAKILLPIMAFSVCALSGCNNDDRVLLSFGDVHASTCKEITTDDLNDVISRKESFMLVVNSTTCGCWHDFKPSLESFINENKALCYQISYDKYIKLEPDARHGLNSLSSGNTTFAIFENGTLKKTITTDTAKNREIMYKEDKFAQYMSENVILPKCFFIEKDDVATIKASGKSAVIYFERSGCGDCNALNPTLLRSYIKEHNDMNNIYVLDCQPYWASQKTSTKEQFDAYVAFKEEMGLAVTTNPNYGYGAGVFPYFSLIENGNYSSGAVVYNDTVEKVGEKYVITDSYYTSEMVQKLTYTNTVLKGMELSSEDVTVNSNYIMWPNDNANEVYKPILNAFLDEALPKVTYTF